MTTARNFGGELSRRVAIQIVLSLIVLVTQVILWAIAYWTQPGGRAPS